ncbi:hypothetical protein [Corynebacterium felinum]|uniref:hypothetical protein n=1 Tax=Corynebacterium felinum TaxID=131318 RepID=UPI00286A8B71|nr:hypothetical protein [Corynebacterium felinum]
MIYHSNLPCVIPSSPPHRQPQPQQRPRPPQTPTVALISPTPATSAQSRPHYPR